MLLFLISPLGLLFPEVKAAPLSSSAIYLLKHKTEIISKIGSKCGVWRGRNIV